MKNGRIPPIESIGKDNEMRLQSVESTPDGGVRRQTFLIAIPTLGMVPIEFCVAFGRLQMPVNSVSSSLIIKGMEVAAARNHAASYTLSLLDRPKYILFLGDDMLPPWDAVLALIDEMETGRWDILSGLYYAKQEPPFAVMWRKDILGPLKPGIHYVPGEVIWVDVCGMDFTAVRPEVFEHLEKPWFRTGPFSEDGKLFTLITEDVYFCDRVRSAGGSIGVHTGVRVAHLYTKSGEVF